jgi:dTDP-4-amino-4,6-dideoxygalactose transaminase
VTIPLVDLRKQFFPLKDEILTGIGKVLEGMQLFLGENVQAFEEEFAHYCGVEYGLGVSDGTSALNFILRAMDIGPGDEVITVSHTFIATAEAILLTGARPVFVDIDPGTYLMDISQVEDRITSRTKALIPVHLYGQTVDMDPLLELASRYHLRVIEDACQAHGAAYRGRKAGSLGDAAAFSFYYSKNLGAYGEGGFITTNDPELYRSVRMIRDHGSERRYYHDLVGMNARLDEIQAVVLRAKFPHLDKWNGLRRSHAAAYNNLLQDSPAITPVEYPENLPVYHLYVIRVPNRDELQTWLKGQGIFTGIHYPIPNHLQPALKSLGYEMGDLPVTEQAATQILSLPMFAELLDEEINFIAETIKSFYHHAEA